MNPFNANTMSKTLSLKVSVSINAPKTKVWDALTNPVQIKKYLFGTETVSDWKVGSPITFRGVWEGKPYEDKGRILEIKKESLLKYNYWSNFPAIRTSPPTTVTLLTSFLKRKAARCSRYVRTISKPKKPRSNLKTTGGWC